MQFSHTHILSKERWTVWALALLKGLVLMGCSAFIIQKIFTQKIQISALVEVLSELSYLSIAGLLVCLFLMPLNWSIEALKWRYLLKPICQISFRQSLRAIVSGLALGFATPMGLGDYFGRIIYVPGADRIRALIPTIISRVSQLVPTLFIGLFGTFVLINAEPSYRVILGWICLMILLSTCILILLRNTSKQMDKLKILSRDFLDKMKTGYRWKNIGVVVAWSSIRYLVFFGQFVLAMWLMEVEAPFFILFAGVSWVFLAKSILPSFNFLSDLGIREFSAILFFDSFGIPIAPVLCASLFIWVINILIPSIAGLVFIGTSKLDLWS